MNKHEYIAELSLLFDQYIGEYDVDHGDVKRFLYCPLGCQGYSKNRKGHFEVNFNVGVCYCHRCVEASSIYSMLKEFKNIENGEYINNLLKLYFNFFEYKSGSGGVSESYNSYDFSIDNIKTSTKIVINLTIEQEEWLQFRFPTIDIVAIKELLTVFKLVPSDKGMFYYFSYFNKFIYLYLQKNGAYVKSKLPNKQINNDKKDYYMNMTSFKQKNLYIAEGLVDLMTVFVNDPLYNATDSNFLALCSRNYSYIYEFLLNTGTLYYDNIYYIMDNDINEAKFISGLIGKLKNGSNNSKYSMFKNFYRISVPKRYVDLNDLYIHESGINSITVTKLL